MNKDNKKNSLKEYMSKKDPFYNWIIRAVIAIALVVVIIVSSVTVMGKINEDRRLYEELVGVNEGRIYEQNGGEGVKDNVFEAESALYSGTISDENGDIGHACAAYSHIINEKFSGGIALRGVQTPENAENLNTFTFRFNSDKKVRLTMSARISAVSKETPLSEIFNITVNGTEPKKFADIKVPTQSVVTVGDIKLTDVNVVIDLEVGENTIILESQKTATSLAFDSINLKTSATLSYTPNYWFNSIAVSDKLPTVNESGSITLKDEHYEYTYDIPNLLEGVKDNAYEHIKNGDNFDVYIANMKLGSVSAQPFTLKLDGEYVQFADGTMETQLSVFSNMPELKFDIPDGIELYGFVDTVGNVYNNAESFVMPNESITLKPVYEDNKYGEELSKEYQKVSLYRRDTNIHSPIRTDKGSGFDQTLLRDTSANGLMFTDVSKAEAEVGAIYKYPTGVKATWSFVTMNSYNTRIAGDKKILNYFQNLGEETIEFSMYQINSSSATDSDAKNENIVLEPGEVIMFELTCNYQNDNLLTLIVFNRATATPLNLGFIQYIKFDGTLPDPEPEPGSTYTVTISEGATFKDGSTMAEVESASKTLPEVVLTGDNAEEGKKLTGWIIDDGKQKKFAKVNEFVMPESDITITPYVTVEFEFDIEQQVGIESGSGILDFSDTDTYDVFGSKQNGCAINKTSAGISASISDRYMIDYGRVGTGFKFSGNKDDYFRIARLYNTRTSPTRTIKYVLKNYGASAISFTLYQVNSGANIEGVPYKEVTLEPGEEETVELTFSYTNQNVMPLIWLNEAATDAKLWMSAEITVDQA